MSLRGAYVELNFFHGEIQPTFWWLARQLGIELDFHLLRPNAMLEPLALLPGPARIVPIDVADPHHPCAEPFGDVEFLDPERYDFVILGTAEPCDRPDSLRDLDLPQLHIMHSARATRADPRVTRCVLAPHAMAPVDPPVLLIEPLYLGEVAASPGEHPMVVSVPGNIQLHRRNYGALIRALVVLRDEGVTPDDVVVRLVGRAFGGEPHLQGRMHLAGPRLLEALETAGVREFVEMYPSELSYGELYEALASSHFVLPLIDDCFIPSRPYLEGKHTGSLGVGIGAGAVPILNERHARAAGVDVGPRYRLDDVVSGLRAALNSGDHVGERAALVALREQRLSASAQSFADWLELVT